jgi:hypothetical protein
VNGFKSTFEGGNAMLKCITQILPLTEEWNLAHKMSKIVILKNLSKYRVRIGVTFQLDEFRCCDMEQSFDFDSLTESLKQNSEGAIICTSNQEIFDQGVLILDLDSSKCQDIYRQVRQTLKKFFDRLDRSEV